MDKKTLTLSELRDYKKHLGRKISGYDASPFFLDVLRATPQQLANFREVLKKVPDNERLFRVRKDIWEKEVRVGSAYRAVCKLIKQKEKEATEATSKVFVDDNIPF